MNSSAAVLLLKKKKFEKLSTRKKCKYDQSFMNFSFTLTENKDKTNG